MKRLIFVIIILLITLSLFSQKDLKKIMGGLYVGTGLSWNSSDMKQVERQGTKFNYGIGATMDINFIDNFAMSFSFGYYKLGTKFSYKYGGKDLIFENAEIDRLSFVLKDSKIVYNMHNLELPVGLKGKTNEIDIVSLPFTFFLKASVVPMFNLKTIGDASGIGVEENLPLPQVGDYKKEVFTKNINRFQLGWQVSGGMEMGLTGTTRLLVEVFYTGGILDIDKTQIYRNELTAEAANPKVSLNNLGLKVGILF